MIAILQMDDTDCLVANLDFSFRASFIQTASHAIVLHNDGYFVG